MGENSGMAIAALVLGIVGWILIWVPGIAQILAILAIVFGIIALNKINANPKIQGRGMAIAGIVLGAIGLIVSILVFIAIFAYFGVLSPTHFIPDSATFSSGFSAVDTPVLDRNANSFSVALSNNLGEAITFPLTTTVTSSNCEYPVLSGTYQGNDITPTTQIADGGTFILTWTCNPFNVRSGDSFKADVTFDYIEQNSGLTSKGTGFISSKVN